VSRTRRISITGCIKCFEAAQSTTRGIYAITLICFRGRRACESLILLLVLEQLQQAVFRCAVGCSPFISFPLSDPLHVFSVEQCTAGKFPNGGASPSRQQDLSPCTASRSGENGCLADGVPTKTPLKVSGSKSCPGWSPTVNEAAHCLTRNLTLRSSRNTTSANHLAFSTKPPLHGLPFAKKTVSTENAFQEVDSS